MFTRLFAESGLSLDRLRALLEVGAAGSIVKAAGGDPVRQSQYSRQIKELEDFFRAQLIERQGKGTRLTSHGRELARLSRFFMVGLSNFQRGCLAEEQTFRIGASATSLRQFVLPVVAEKSSHGDDAAYATEVVSDGEIERRLHDLTLDFGVVRNAVLSRPLQTKLLGNWNLELWIPKRLRLSQSKAVEAFEKQQLPLVLARRELEGLDAISRTYQPHLICDSFLDVLTVMDGEEMAALLPDFLAQIRDAKRFVRIPLLKLESLAFQFHLAWNPRLLRLNPPAIKKRDWLAEGLSKKMAKRSELERFSRKH
jgi:DNA-binding transcriptional LysR family regulator